MKDFDGRLMMNMIYAFGPAMHMKFIFCYFFRNKSK